MGTSVEVVSEIKEAVIDIHGYTVSSDWEPTEEDISLVLDVINEGFDIEGAIEEIRVDSKTDRLMTAGWIVCDEYYYSSMADAEQKIKELGFKGIEEANDEYATESDNCPICYYTEWVEV